MLVFFWVGVMYTCRCNLGFTRTSDGKSCHDLTVSSNFKLLRSCQILPALAAVSSAITRLTPFLSYSTAARNRVEHLFDLTLFHSRILTKKILHGSERKILGALNQPFSLVSPPNHIQLRCSGIKVAEMSGATKALNAR